MKINLIIITALALLSVSVTNKHKKCQCTDLLENLYLESEQPLIVKIITDSTRLDLPPMKAFEYFRQDSLNIKYGAAGIYFSDDGCYFSGTYNENGLKDGIWTLFKCRKGKSMNYEKYHFKNGFLYGVITDRKIKQKKLDSIPLVW